MFAFDGASSWWGAAAGAQQRTLGPWQARTSGFGTQNVRALAYGGGVWVAVGNNGIISRSMDNGQTWATVTSGFGTTSIADVAYADDAGTFVAVGESKKVAISTDGGLTWAQRVTGISGTPHFSRVARGNGFWIIGGKPTSGNAVFYRSTDALSWSAVGFGNLIGNNLVGGICYSGDKWIVTGSTGRIVTSIDDGTGGTLTATGVPSSLSAPDIAFSDEAFVIVGDTQRILRSPDGAQWQSVYGGVVGQLNRVRFGDGMWMAVGAVDKIIASLDSVDWSGDSSPTSNALYALGYGNDTYIIAGQAGYLATASWS